MVISSELEYLWLSWKNNESYRKIEKQIDLLNELLETFLFISKIENFKWDIKKDHINIWDIILEQINAFNKVYSYKNLTIVNNINTKIKLKTNEKLFVVLFKNILDNAFKYNNTGWKVIIDWNEKCLIIKDSWIWINKIDLSKIFDSFYRVEKTKKWYGVWLNIVQKIVNILGYKIEIQSKESKGTEFKILFK
jgi:two-component system phosphate regulon sensor histidine kinase PhoR